MCEGISYKCIKIAVVSLYIVKFLLYIEYNIFLQVTNSYYLLPRQNHSYPEKEPYDQGVW